MKSNIYTEYERKYVDVYIYVTSFNYLSREEWRRCVSLDTEYGTMHEGDWMVSPDGDGFDDTDRCPPLEVLQEYSRRYPEMVALIMKERLNGTA